MSHDVAAEGARGAGSAMAIAAPLTDLAPAAEPTLAERARTLVAGAGRGALATLSAGRDGHPFGSVAPYGLLPGGLPVICISSLAEHTRNLGADRRASLLVTAEATDSPDPGGRGGRPDPAARTGPADSGDPPDVLARGRASLLVTARRLEPGRDEEGWARDAVVAAHPSSAAYARFGDFGCWALDVAAVYVVWGFGRMGWVSGDEYRAAEPDPLAPAEAGICAHMNDDHAGACRDYVAAFGGHPDATAARLVAVDRLGFELRADTPRGQAWVRLGFDPPVRSTGQVREALVALALAARRDIAGRSAR